MTNEEKCGMDTIRALKVLESSASFERRVAAASVIREETQSIKEHVLVLLNTHKYSLRRIDKARDYLTRYSLGAA